MSSTITWCSRWSRSTGCISTSGSAGWPTAAGYRASSSATAATTALMDPMTKALVADIHGFVAARGLELVSFAKGQRKDDLAQEFLAKFTDEEGVLFVGRAQEKAGVWRTQRRYSPPSGVAMPGWCAPRRSSTSSTSTAWTPEFGPFFISSAPTSD